MTYNPSSKIEFRQFNTLASEWGTDHDFTIVGDGDVFNGWTFENSSGNLTGVTAAFSSGKLTLAATGDGSGSGDLVLVKNFTSTIPIWAWPSVDMIRKLDASGTTLGPGKVDSAYVYTVLKDVAATQYANISWRIEADGTQETWTSAKLNTGAAENGIHDANAWAGAFDVNDHLSIGQRDVGYFSDTPNGVGRLESISRVGSGLTFADMRNWSVGGNVLQVKIFLAFVTNTTRALAVDFDEFGLFMYGDIS